MVNGVCTNVLSVNLNESIVLFGHDTNFKSDDTFELIILLAKVFHLFKNYRKTTFEVYKYVAIINMSYDKFI